MVRKSRDIPQCEHNETRMQRAWIWHEQSEKSISADEKFIFLWIAFNAAYGFEIPTAGTDDKPTPEREKFRTFPETIVKQDKSRRIKNML